MSPDGLLIAYGELRDEKWEVFVASFPAFHDIKAGIGRPAAHNHGGAATAGNSSSSIYDGAMMSATVDRGSRRECRYHHESYSTPDWFQIPQSISMQSLKMD